MTSGTWTTDDIDFRERRITLRSDNPTMKYLFFAAAQVIGPVSNLRSPGSSLLNGIPRAFSRCGFTAYARCCWSSSESASADRRLTGSWTARNPLLIAGFRPVTGDTNQIAIRNERVLNRHGGAGHVCAIRQQIRVSGRLGSLERKRNAREIQRVVARVQAIAHEMA